MAVLSPVGLSVFRFRYQGLTLVATNMPSASQAGWRKFRNLSLVDRFCRPLRGLFVLFSVAYAALKCRAIVIRPLRRLSSGYGSLHTAHRSLS